jgi:hypothetical protein
MMPSPSKRAANRQHWLEHIQHWQHSGLTQKAFCEQHHLGLKSFQRWHGKFKQERKPHASSSTTFLPVNITHLCQHQAEFPEKQANFPNPENINCCIINEVYIFYP